MITKTLGTSSRKFARLRTDFPHVGLFAQALFPLLVASCDDFGRQQADAFTVKHSVWSTAPEPESTFELALQAMHDVCLIQRYSSEDATYLQVVDFEEHQQGLHKKTESRFPNPPEIPGNSGKFPLKRTELNLTEGKRTEPPRAGNSGGVFSGSLPREHLHHAVCDDTFSRCVPEAVHVKFISQLAPKHQGDRQKTDEALRAWYPTVWAGLPADFVMGEAFKFWVPRFDAAFASSSDDAMWAAAIAGAKQDMANRPPKWKPEKLKIAPR